MRSRKTVLLLVIGALLAASGGAVGGYFLGKKDGVRSGFEIGLRRGEVRFARQGPPEVIDRKHSLAALSATPAWAALGSLEQGEPERLAALLNGAPSPCFRQARRGQSLATALVEPAKACLLAPEQVRLALVALRTFEDPDESLAVLRVERRARPDTEGRHFKGAADSAVVVAEWGDFQCPACRNAQGLPAGLLRERDDIKVVFKHLPLSFHPAAWPAALAAEAAGEQGKFWEMHDALFDMGKAIGDGIDADEPVPPEGPVPFESLARDLGLDLERFRADVRSEKLEARVRDDMAEARSLRVNATPTFFVGAQRVQGRLSVDRLNREVIRAQGEQNWRFSWDLPELPQGVEEPPATPAGEPAEAAPASGSSAESSQ